MSSEEKRRDMSNKISVEEMQNLLLGNTPRNRFVMDLQDLFLLRDKVAAEPEDELFSQAGSDYGKKFVDFVNKWVPE
jgi:hypothetical protein